MSIIVELSFKGEFSSLVILSSVGSLLFLVGLSIFVGFSIVGLLSLFKLGNSEEKKD